MAIEGAYFVDNNKNPINAEQFLEAFEGELKEQVSKMQDTAEWKRYTEDYEAKSIDLLADMMASSMTIEMMKDVLEGLYLDSVIGMENPGSRAGTYGSFVESEILGLPTSPNPMEDIQEIVGDDTRRIEVKASTFHNAVTVGKITAFGVTDSAPEEAGGALVREFGTLESVRNIAALYKMATKMRNLVLWYLEEVQKNARYGVHITSIQLYTILLLQKLKENIMQNKVISVKKKGSYNKENMSQTYILTLNIATERAVRHLVEMYARKTDITHILGRVNDDLAKRAVINMIKYEPSFEIN